MRVLITGFGPFPGAPSNPTMRLARKLAALKRPRLLDLERVLRLLPTTWAMLDGVPAMLESVRPDAVLMFGVAGRRRRITPECRLVNRATTLRTDAEGRKPAHLALRPAGPDALRPTISAARLAARLRRAGLPARVSRDAGDYLCNALAWTVTESGVPAIFVHVPPPRRSTSPKGRSKRPRPSAADLLRAGEMALDVVIQTAAPKVTTP
jgi:pyroglutamyl-peptidase